MNKYSVSFAQSEYERCFPALWSEDVTKDLEAKELVLLETQRSDIIRQVLSRMMAEDLGRDEDFEVVAALLLKRVPALGSNVCPGTVSTLIFRFAYLSTAVD